MTTHVGTIVGFESTMGSGLGILTVVDEAENTHRLVCEAAPTYRALREAFANEPVGQEIAYSLDEYGVLKSFTPLDLEV